MTPRTRRRKHRSFATGCLLLLGACLLTACASTTTPRTRTAPTAPTPRPAHAPPTAATRQPGSGPTGHPATRAGATYSTGTKVPSSFPSSVPLPSGYMTITSTTGQRTDAGWLLTVAIKGPASTAIQSYRHQLTAAGFAVTNPVQSGLEQYITARSSRWIVNASVATMAGTAGQALPGSYVEMSIAVGSISALRTLSGG